MTPREVLQGIRELLTPASAWTTTKYAKDRFGYSVRPYSKEAQCFCLLGAVCRVTASSVVWPSEDTVQADAINLLIKAMPEHYRGSDLVRFNDLSTHEEVLALIDRGIEIAT